MKVSYLGLWKKLLENEMKKQDLVNVIGLSSATVAKMGKNELVSKKVLNKICDYFKCNASEIIEIIDDEIIADTLTEV